MPGPRWPPGSNTGAPRWSWCRRNNPLTCATTTTRHTKNDRLDSRVLARLPLLHPEGLRPMSDSGPADPLRRAVRRRSSLVERRTATFYRLDALLELLGPAWADALGSGAYCKAALAVLHKTGADPHAVRRLGRSRLTALLIRHSRGAWREEHAERILEAAQQTLALWPDGTLDFAELAEDIAAEAQMADHLYTQITSLEDRIAVLYQEADPAGVILSGPGPGRRLRRGHPRQTWGPEPLRQPRRYPRLHRPGPPGQPVRPGQPQRAAHAIR
ncbi:transposase [Streptomyces sp. A1499]|uniref:IS110 family transposase n=1 Tax=Streptomyces sp. A1499 TaxID=2563104 RepID=UPI0019D1DB72|nr:transposase [Streptomyces sp. A1499]